MFLRLLWSPRQDDGFCTEIEDTVEQDPIGWRQAPETGLDRPLADPASIFKTYFWHIVDYILTWPHPL